MGKKRKTDDILKIIPIEITGDAVTLRNSHSGTFTIKYEINDYSPKATQFSFTLRDSEQESGFSCDSLRDSPAKEASVTSERLKESLFYMLKEFLSQAHALAILYSLEKEKKEEAKKRKADIEKSLTRLVSNVGGIRRGVKPNSTRLDFSAEVARVKEAIRALSREGVSEMAITAKLVADRLNIGGADTGDDALRKRLRKAGVNDPWLVFRRKVLEEPENKTAIN